MKFFDDLEKRYCYSMTGETFSLNIWVIKNGKIVKENFWTFQYMWCDITNITIRQVLLYLNSFSV